eukprot:TRINITY_DN2150_c0_g3_i2.p1 TRINITY_DN2150_c0_g3~~TRINITY_DN2150_c0_g3_i2.p1  ORF type:complete len:171 (+),score=27.60 TRINITY_DN2150_c0_g3_i2:391-903(+)
MLSAYYGDSVPNAVTSMFPDFPWDIGRFRNIPQNYWRSEQNQRAFFDELAKTLGLQRWQDWYQVSAEDIKAHGGATLITHHYGGYISKALTAVYPELPWDFSSSDINWTEQPAERRRELVEQIGGELDVQHPEDWYQIDKADFGKFGGRTATEALWLMPSRHYFRTTDLT